MARGMLCPGFCGYDPRGIDKNKHVIFVSMKMKYTNYRRGGFFGNSQDKFSDMEGAGQGINMAFGSQGRGPGRGLGKGAALRREKRYLKKLERQGKLNEEGPRSADRLDYLKKVQRDRIKKGVGGAALAAGAVATGGALAANPGALSGLAGKAGAGLSKAGSAIKGGLAKGKTALQGLGKSKTSGLLKGLEGKSSEGAMKLLKKKGGEGIGKELLTGDNPIVEKIRDRILQAGLNDPDMQPDEENIDDNLRFDSAGLPLFDVSGGDSLMDRIGLGEYRGRQSDRYQPMGMKDLLGLLNIQGRNVLPEAVVEAKGGMKILKGGQKKLDKNNDGRITGEDFKLLQAMKAMYGAKLPR